MRVEAANVRSPERLKTKPWQQVKAETWKQVGPQEEMQKSTEAAIPTYFSFPAISSCSAFVSWI
jgi:hypothetical protein